MDSYADLADEVKAYIKRFCYLDSESKYDIATLWAFHTHVRTSDDKLAFAETPRLAILSDLPASGKTRVLEIINSLSFKGQNVLSPSSAGLLDAINEDNSTVGIDEIDLLFGRNSKQELRTIINGGYRVGSYIRHRGNKQDTFGPVVLAGMAQNFLNNDHLAATRSRSIIIRMERRPENATIEPYRAVAQRPIAAAFRDVMTYWGKKYANDLAFAWPELPDGINDRDADIWSPLLAVGELLGDTWSRRAKEACVSSVLSKVTSSETRPMSPREKLLFTLSLALDTTQEKITTSKLLDSLEAHDSSWGRHASKRAAAMELSAILEPLGIRPVKIHDTETQTSKQGYRVPEFLEFLPTSDLPSVESEDEDDPALLPI